MPRNQKETGSYGIDSKCCLQGPNIKVVWN